MSEMIMSVIFVLVMCIVFGVVGSILGSTVKKKSAGFWLGLFLGPIGWIIVFLLPREGAKEKDVIKTSNQRESLQKNKKKFEGEVDIKTPKYQLYLTEKYNIKKNDTLEKFTVNDEVFDTLEDALKYTSDLDSQIYLKVMNVSYDGACFKAGIMTGDIIAKFCGAKVETDNQFTALISQAKEKDFKEYTIEISRKGENFKYTIPVGPLGIVCEEI